MQKKLIDFTVEEAVRRAVGAFGEQETDENAKHEDERNALQTVVNFKISEQQISINKRLITLTRWLVVLTIFLVILTIITTIKLFI